MQDQRQLVIRGSKLVFEKVKHRRSTFELWLKAAKRGNKRAIRLLARLVLDHIHCGLISRRSLVLDALRAASVLGPKYRRLYGLFVAFATGRSVVIDPIIIEAAEAGDDISCVFLGMAMPCMREAQNWKAVVQFYGLLARSVQNSRCTHAARCLANQLFADGHVDVAITLLTWAARRGDFGALGRFAAATNNLGLDGRIASTDYDLVLNEARRSAFVDGDPWAAFYLACCLLEDNGDVVAGIRAYRRALAGGVDGRTRFGFCGETLWRTRGNRKSDVYRLLFEKPYGSRPRVNFSLVLQAPSTQSG